MNTLRETKQQVKDQYSTNKNLDARIALHNLFTVCKQPYAEWVRSKMPLKEGMKVLEVGCGEGKLWRENQHSLPQIELTLTDFSEAMLQTAKQRSIDMPFPIQYMQADVCSLPFDDHSFDMVLAHHMMHHIPDHAKALSEIVRVLVPGGVLTTTAPGDRNLYELWRMLAQISSLNDWREISYTPSFSMENGQKWLEQFFDTVQIFEYPSKLVINQVGPVIDYLNSMEHINTALQNKLPVDWRESLKRAMQKEIDKRGAFTVQKATGIFVCS